MKLRTKAFLFASVLVGLLVVILSDDQEVFLESKESKTIEASPVFNKIRWFRFKDKDVWMMNQSHHGAKGLGQNSWDRLAIVVDKTQNPKRAQFYQLEPGPLEWKDGLKEAPFKVSCFMCHSNGPRAIRPNYDSPLNPTAFRERVKISYWNLRMKLYGRVLPHRIHAEKVSSLERPFQFYSSFETESLKVKTCMKCHKDSGLFARGFLSRQQIPTIKFMLESGEMPPVGFTLSQDEKSQLEKYLEGF